MSRKVEGLIWANRGIRPVLPIKGTGRPNVKAGLKYEADLAQALSVGLPGVWWHYCDKNGTGWCQTDLLLRGASRDLVLEAKLTYTAEAWRQLELLYLPVLGCALARPIFGIQVCKRFLSGVGSEVMVVTDLGEAIHFAAQGHRTVLHWLGPKLSPPLWPLRRVA